MLQTLKSPIRPDRGAPAPQYLSHAELLDISTGFLQRQYPVIVFTLLVMMALAAIYVLSAQPKYTAQAKLLIDTRKVQLFQQQSVLGDIPPDPASVDSQVEILQSENVARAVIKELHLTEDPEFMSPRGDLVSAIKGIPSAIMASISSLFASSEGSRPNTILLKRLSQGCTRT